MSSAPTFQVNLRECSSQKDAFSTKGRIPLFNATSSFKMEYSHHGCGVDEVVVPDVTSNFRPSRTRGKKHDSDHKPLPGVHVKEGCDGKSIIKIGDDQFGLSIETNLANTDVVVATAGETQLISGKGGEVTIEKKLIGNRNAGKLGETNPSASTGVRGKQQKDVVLITEPLFTNRINEDEPVKLGSERKTEETVVSKASGKGREGGWKDTLVTSRTQGNAKITQTKTAESKYVKGVHTEKKTTITESKTTTGKYTSRSVESTTEAGKDIGVRSAGRFAPPKASGRKETAAERRSRENRGVSAKNNPFKQNDSRTPAKQPPANSRFGKFTPATSAATADAASGNIEKLLKWIQKRVNQYEAVNVTNFTSSWEDGIALCALMNYLLGDEVLPSSEVSSTDKKKNFEMALKVATEHGVPALLVASELASGAIERRSMITYLHLVYTKLFADKKEEKKEEKTEEQTEEQTEE